MRREHPEFSIYWVINRDSPDVEKAMAIGPVLFADCFKTYVRAFLAQVHVISHGIHDVPGCWSQHSARAIKVRVGHGLTALKRTKPRFGHSDTSANAIFDLIPVCSEFERVHKLEWGIDPRRLVITGIPRFDTLLALRRKLPSHPRRVLYMPTWRDGSAGASDWRSTAFFQGVRKFLKHPTLRMVLSRRDGELRVFFHMNMARHADQVREDIDDDRIQIVTDSDPQRLFVECGALITDYSSVAWDVLYLNKPVMLYQFDRDDFEACRGGYLAADELPGPVATTAEGMIQILDDYLSEKLASQSDLIERTEQWQKKAFAFRDDRNCERVVAEILKLLDERSRISLTGARERANP
jgi:CDP-glycerol glycerophosphotransferase